MGNKCNWWLERTHLLYDGNEMSLSDDCVFSYLAWPSTVSLDGPCPEQL